jgi:adenylate cyclase
MYTSSSSNNFGRRLLTFFGPFIFSGGRPSDSEEDRLRKGLLMGGSLLILPVAIIWAGLYATFNEWPAAIITLAYAIANGSSIIYLSRTGQKTPLAFVHWFCTLFLPFVLTILLGGLVQSSALILGALMAPLGALLYYPQGRATWLFIGFVVLVLVAGAIDPLVQRDNNLPSWLILTLFILNVIIVSSLAFFQMRAFVRQRDDALARLRLEQDRSDRLLNNILPQPIANILKYDQRTIAECFDSVSILFADVVGFTPLAGEVDAAQMVEFLNEIYTRFDEIIDKYQLEKIRTMGDGYMVASGVPESRSDHAQALARAALEMMAFINQWEPDNKDDIAVRMGINSGRVMAGVIGRKKFSYDVWGDPVNIASRMESHGEAGKIQVSQDTYQLLKDDFSLEPRGMIYIKGKGEMQTWFLTGEQEKTRPSPAKGKGVAFNQ